jgi:hypothetical protein
MDQLPDLTSPISLRNRKRTHSKHLDSGFADFSESKSRRTSPSPYMMGAAMTPGSSSGYDYPMFGDGLFGLTLFVNKFHIPFIISWGFRRTLFTDSLVTDSLM